MSDSSWLTKRKISRNVDVKRDMKVPFGHIIAAEKWKMTPLSQDLAKEINVMFEGNLGIVDFFLPNGLAVVYILDVDLISGSSYKEKVAKFKYCRLGHQNIVFLELNPLSIQYFQDAQNFIHFELNMEVMAVSSQKDATEALVHLVQSNSQQASNPFFVKSRLPPAEVTFAIALQSIPNVGQVKVQALLQKYQDVISLSEASVSDLQGTVTTHGGQHVHNFFNKNIEELIQNYH